MMGIVSGVLLMTLIYVSALAVERDDAFTTLLDFRITDLNILSGDGTQVIGHAKYKLSASGGAAVLRGESTYFNGERDIEVVRLKPRPGGQTPTLIGYEHSFFNPDGSYQRVINLDVGTGVASCKTFVHQELEERRSHVMVPDDTYAGASIIVFVVMRLRQRAEHLKFYSFNCVPGPKIIATEASIETDRQVEVPIDPGNLIKMEMRPDFGWADFLVGPFVGKMYAWFDPSDNWNYVGGVYNRFYGGPRIMTALVAQPHKRKDTR